MIKIREKIVYINEMENKINFTSKKTGKLAFQNGKLILYSPRSMSRILWEISLQESTFTLIFQPILHRFWSNIAIYMSRALMDVWCEFGIIWIKTEGAFH